jgi:hypothetical protein
MTRYYVKYNFFLSQWKRLRVHWRGKKALINNEKIYYIKKLAIASKIKTNLEVMSASGVVTNNVMKTTYPFRASGFCEPVLQKLQETRQNQAPFHSSACYRNTLLRKIVTRPPTRGLKATF